MANIFISYRRDDSADVTGRIFDSLTRKFGKDNVFKDVDSIPYGVNFAEHLQQVIDSCMAVLVVIGPDWLTMTDQDGNRRLDNPQDYVRMEVAMALRRGIPVVPLLTQGTAMPAQADLPVDLKELTMRNGTPVRRDPDFHPDMERLIERLVKEADVPVGLARRLLAEADEVAGPQVEKARQSIGAFAKSLAEASQPDPTRALKAPPVQYEWAGADLPALAEELRAWLEDQEFEAQVVEDGDALIVQGRKGFGSIVRGVTGLRYTGTVILEPNEGGFGARVGGGDWLDKAKGVAVGYYLTMGLGLIGAGVGAVNQKKLVDSLRDHLDEIVVAWGGRRLESEPE